MTFKLKHSMKKHQLTHKAEFGHTCDICGKKFKVSRVATSTNSPTRPSSGTPVIFVAKSSR
jgi:hypothetical protein